MTRYVTPLEDFGDGRGIRAIGTADTAAELAEFAGIVEATIRGGDNPVGHLHHLHLSPRQHRDALRTGAVQQGWVATAVRHRQAHHVWQLANKRLSSGQLDQSIYDPPKTEWRDPRPWQRRNAGGVQLRARTGKARQPNRQLTLIQ